MIRGLVVEAWSPLWDMVTGADTGFMKGGRGGGGGGHHILNAAGGSE